MTEAGAATEQAVISTAQSGRRLHELDSIRGLAAVAVALFHFFLGWLGFGLPAGWRSTALKMIYPLYAGPEAVRLFFVLSGIVLALSYGRGQSYGVFIGRRVTRIYGPYLVALALTVLAASIWHGHIEHSALKDCCWSEPVNRGLVVQHILFLGDYDFAQLNPVFWSLVHEMRISIIFPLLYVVVNRLSTRGALVLAACCTLVSMTIMRFFMAWITPIAPMSLAMTVHYIAFFILGILIAKNLSSVGEWYIKLGGGARWALLLVSFILYNFTALTATALLGPHTKLLIGVSDWGTALGALGLIVTVLFSVRVNKIFRSAVPVFLGKISYSLYLIHIPVLLALAFTLQKKFALSASMMLPVYSAVALVCAFVFCVAVEQPFTRLGRKLKDSRKPTIRDLTRA